MVPIKSNQLLNQFSPLDLANIKSQPLRLTKITAIVAVLIVSSCGFLTGGYLCLATLTLPTSTRFLQ
ncbi:hypothetical protein Hanom_Chr01g00070101 [Helianthus anomalus]